MKPIYNRQAGFNFHILDTYEAGLVLTGSEVKSVRAGRVDLSQSFAKIQNGQVYLKNAYIFPYFGQRPEYDPRHDRKLLLHKKQINELIGKTSGSAHTLLPLQLYQVRNFIKVKIALAASKKKYDKRRAIKEREQNRRIKQELSNY